MLSDKQQRQQQLQQQQQQQQEEQQTTFVTVQDQEVQTICSRQKASAATGRAPKTGDSPQTSVPSQSQNTNQESQTSDVIRGQHRLNTITDEFTQTRPTYAPIVITPETSSNTQTFQLPSLNTTASTSLMTEKTNFWPEAQMHATFPPPIVCEQSPPVPNTEFASQNPQDQVATPPAMNAYSHATPNMGKRCPCVKIIPLFTNIPKPDGPPFSRKNPARSESRDIPLASHWNKQSPNSYKCSCRACWLSRMNYHTKLRHDLLLQIGSCMTEFDNHMNNAQVVTNITPLVNKYKDLREHYARIENYIRKCARERLTEGAFWGSVINEFHNQP